MDKPKDIWKLDPDPYAQEATARTDGEYVFIRHTYLGGRSSLNLTRHEARTLALAILVNTEDNDGH